MLNLLHLQICLKYRCLFGETACAVHDSHWVMRVAMHCIRDCNAQKHVHVLFEQTALWHLMWQWSIVWTVMVQVEPHRFYFALHSWWSSVQVDFHWVCRRASKAHTNRGFTKCAANESLTLTTVRYHGIRRQKHLPTLLLHKGVWKV